MDIYLGPKAVHTEEVILRDAKEFYEARGHKYILHQKLESSFANDDHPYHPWMTVFQSEDVAEGDFPVDLIFTPTHTTHEGQFDLGICEEYFYLHPFNHEALIARNSTNALRDEANGTITVLSVDDSMGQRLRGWREMTDQEFESSYRRLKGHLDRVMEKYPERRLVMDCKISIELGKVYARLLEDGYFGEARAVLPTETSITERDSVRQLDREELVRVMRGEEFTDQVQTRARPVRDPAQVPAGLFNWDVEDVLRRARQWGNHGVPEIPAPEPEPIGQAAVRGLRGARNTLVQGANGALRNNGPRDLFGNLR